MSTTTITGTINGVNNTALANKWITFRLVQLGTDSGATATVAQSVDSVQTDANGNFSINVWNNGDSGKTSVLEITIDGSKAENVIIPTGTASIELWDLIENYQADGSTSEQIPVVSSLFLRKSLNLSDVSNKLIASQNLDLEVGVDVQAHSATLDATTASFTTADESKLDGIEASADVTDATNIAASGGYIAGGTDVALADGGTGASDTSTARTNLGLVIGSDVQEHSSILDATTASFTTADESKLDGIEALADVTDATNIAASGGYVAGGTDVALTDGGTGASDAFTARTNLGVPSSAEALLVTNNLSEVDPDTARANLGVLSSQEGLSAENNLSELTPTAFTARTNIDVPSTSEAVLVANNLSEVDPVLARANLGVPSSQEGLSAANNLSELTATSATARTNIGVEIGSDVQAHSAILDATTASFTIAKDTAISTNASDILNNASDILNNSTNIAFNETDIANAENAISNNTIAINDKVPNDLTTGTADATTFLRGDNTWSVPDSGTGGEVGTDAIWDAKGDLAGGIGPNAATRLPLGNNLQVLTVDRLEATGMKWTTLPTASGGIATDPIWDAKGDIAGGTGLDASARLAIGTNTQVLTADSAESTGMKWQTPETIATDSIWDAKGDLVGGTGADTSSRLAVGTDAQVLTADSASPTGMKWETPAVVSGDIATDSIWDAKGDIAVATGVDTASRLAAGVDSQVLTADSSSPTGMKWSTPVATTSYSSRDYPYTSYFRDSTDPTPFYVKNFATITDASGFYQDINLNSVYVGGNCTLIDYQTFYQCFFLYDVTIGSGVITIGDNAFQSCQRLASISISNTVQTIGNNAFTNCNGLESINTGDGVVSIGVGAFYNCFDMLTAVIGDSVVTTGAIVFQNCTSLTSIILGKSVEVMGDQFADGATLLTSITIPDSLNEIGDDSLENTGITFTQNFGNKYLSSPSYSFLFNGNPSATGGVLIQETINGKPVRVIADSSFVSNTNITEVIIPSGIIRIGKNAFNGCISLSSISCFATEAPDIGANAFNNVSATTIDVPIGATGYGVTYGFLTVNYVL